MSGLSTLLETARRALVAQQIGIATTGHNIANVSTQGYSRQVVNLGTTTPEQRLYGFLGTGVMVESINRLRDQFLDEQIRTTNATMGEANARQSTLSEIEASFNEPSSAGLSSALSSFFNAFQELSLHPEDSSSRNVVLQQGALLSQSFHRLYDELRSTQRSLMDGMETKVQHVNELTARISSLNTQITAASDTGASPNDLMDQRDNAISELSTLVNVSVSTDARGAAMVSVGGIVVASGANAQTLYVQNTPAGSRILTEKENVPVAVSGGELGADLAMANTAIPGYLSKLDDLAGALIARVNTVHSAGYGLGTPPATGLNFFSGTTAADMNVSAAVAGNPAAVATSQTGAPGNNQTALAIAGIASETLLGGGTLTLNQFYNGLVTGIGSDVTGAQSVGDTQQLILKQLTNQQSAVSGVSLDEEMTNLIQYQRAFDAAARLVSTTNDMFTTILNMLPTN